MPSPLPVEWRVFADADRLAHAAAEILLEIGRQSIVERGRFTIALSGGSTPERLYRLLAAAPYDDQIDWSRVQLFMGDERCVPADDGRSNFHMVSHSLLAGDKPKAAAMHPVRTELGTPQQCAAAYGAELAKLFGVTPPGAWPQFDLILLGLGDDGHTASLFPHAAALKVNDAIVTASPPGVLPPPVDRVTLTFPVLNAARNAMFLVAGANKGAALKDIYQGRATIEERPASGVRPSAGKLIWLLDQAAAGSASITR